MRKQQKVYGFVRISEKKSFNTYVWRQEAGHVTPLAFSTLPQRVKERLDALEQKECGGIVREDGAIICLPPGSLRNRIMSWLPRRAEAALRDFGGRLRMLGAAMAVACGLKRLSGVGLGPKSGPLKDMEQAAEAACETLNEKFSRIGLGALINYTPARPA